MEQSPSEGNSRSANQELVRIFETYAQLLGPQEPTTGP